jgi:hypothetical protein
LTHALLFGTGVGLPASLLFGEAVLLSWGSRDFPAGCTSLVDEVLIRVLPYITGGVALALVVWTLSRWTRGAVIVHDEPICPRCEYSLRGNTTGICPECGHAYTLKELGIG